VTGRIACTALPQDCLQPPILSFYLTAAVTDFTEMVSPLAVPVTFMAAGLAMVLAHNIWSGGALVVVVTVVGWMTLTKSLLFLFLPPEVEAGLFLGQLHYQQLFYLYGVFSLVLGLYLTYGGFLSKSH
jgi:hypothetical protein